MTYAQFQAPPAHGDAAALTQRFDPVITAHDWASGPLGAIDTWPLSLKLLVAQISGSPLSMLVRWGPRLIQIFNSAALTMLGDDSLQLMGTSLSEVRPERWASIALFHEAALRGRSHVQPHREYSVASNGRRSMVWMDVTFSPAFDDDGSVAGVIVIATESTKSVRQAQAAQAAAAEHARIQALLEDAPGYIAVLRGPEHRLDVVNRKMRRLVGPGRVIGRRLADVAPQVATPEFMAVLDTVARKGERVLQRRLPIMPSPGVEELSGPRFFDLVCQPTRGLDGEITGVFVMGTDVTEHVDALDRQALLSNELNHRVKNTLAVILSVARLSAKSADDLDQFTLGFTERVEAMANTHDLLTEVGWTVVEVRDIIDLELAPYAAAAGRIQVTCEPVHIAAAEAVKLALVVHELFANAAKHGALRSADGRMEITCRKAVDGIRLDWREDAGFPLPAVAKPGFGTLLIDRLMRDFGGAVVRRLGPSGLSVTLDIPLRPSAVS